MNYPPLLQGKTPDEYRSIFEAMYCRGPIQTFDGIEVRFRRKDFNHCFFESVHSKDDTFSPLRAERIQWIKSALQDPDSDRRIGWDSTRKLFDKNRRVAIVMGNYVVVILLTGNKKADFVTAFVADSDRTFQMLKKSPKWA